MDVLLYAFVGVQQDGKHDQNPKKNLIKSIFKILFKRLFQGKIESSVPIDGHVPSVLLAIKDSVVSNVPYTVYTNQGWHKKLNPKNPAGFFWV